MLKVYGYRPGLSGYDKTSDMNSPAMLRLWVDIVTIRTNSLVVSS